MAVGMGAATEKKQETDSNIDFEAVEVTDKALKVGPRTFFLLLLSTPRELLSLSLSPARSSSLLYRLSIAPSGAKHRERRSLTQTVCTRARRSTSLTCCNGGCSMTST